MVCICQALLKSSITPSYSLFMPLPVFTLWIMALGSRVIDISEDWEKDFDLEKTEEEVQMALSSVDASSR